MKKGNIFIFLLFILGSLALLSFTKPDAWGFYGHRMINRMAIFTLPAELFGFYKQNVDYMTEHAVDPDKRRYATKHEAVRHYIDIDMWGVIPFDNVPRDFEEAIIKHCKMKFVYSGDTSYFTKVITADSIVFSTMKLQGVRLALEYPLFVKYWKKIIKPMYYEDEWKISGYDLDELFNSSYFTKYKIDVLIEDHFSEHGIVPYHLEAMQSKLTYAFANKDEEAILRISAEFGHYIGDAHVPLHTTINYNGQLTDQVGIHGFWESRVPELFAEQEYDFFVGKATFIEDPRSYFWDIVTKAHSHLDSVLLVDKRLRRIYEQDQIYCYDERLGRTLRMECPEFARAYSEALGTMVEDQMRGAIHALGSCIYTAWVNAGQPELKFKGLLNLEPEKIQIDNSVITRSHEE